MSPRDSDPTPRHNNDLRTEITVQGIITWDGTVRDELSRHINPQEDTRRTLPFMQMPLHALICSCTVGTVSHLAVL